MHVGAITTSAPTRDRAAQLRKRMRGYYQSRGPIVHANLQPSCPSSPFRSEDGQTFPTLSRRLSTSDMGSPENEGGMMRVWI